MQIQLYKYIDKVNTIKKYMGKRHNAYGSIWYLAGRQSLI